MSESSYSMVPVGNLAQGWRVRFPRNGVLVHGKVLQRAITNGSTVEVVLLVGDKVRRYHAPASLTVAVAE